MDAADYIVEKILNDAHETAAFLVTEAKKQAADKLRSAMKEAEKQEETNMAKAKNNIKDLKGRSLQLAAVEKRKAELSAKHAILDSVFNEARSEIHASKDYKNLIQDLIVKHCNCDACIVVSKQDEKVLTAEFIKTCATKIKCKLSRRVENNFEGGIIIESSKYDISLTLDDLFASARKQIGVKAANILWG